VKWSPALSVTDAAVGDFDAQMPTSTISRLPATEAPGSVTVSLVPVRRALACWTKLAELAAWAVTAAVNPTAASPRAVPIHNSPRVAVRDNLGIACSLR